MPEIIYTNSTTIDPRYVDYGKAVLYPLMPDAVFDEDSTIGDRYIEIWDEEESEIVVKTKTNELGFFIVTLPDEGVYVIKIPEDNIYFEFKTEIELEIGKKAEWKRYGLIKKTLPKYADLLITPREIRDQYLFGLSMVDSSGKPFTDEMVSYFIRQAVGKAERMLHVNINKKRIRAGAVTQEEGVKYDLIEPGYDYDIRDFRQWNFLVTRRRPVIEVHSMEFSFPLGQNRFVIPKDWIQPYYQQGQVQLVPTAGTISQVMMTSMGSWGPMFSSWLPGAIPQILGVDYTVGIDVSRMGMEIVDELRHAIGLEAAIEILGVTGDAILAGIASQSISGEGISESFGTTASATSATYQARIESYRKQLEGRTQGEKGLWDKLADYWGGGIEMVVV